MSNTEMGYQDGESMKSTRPGFTQTFIRALLALSLVFAIAFEPAALAQTQACSGECGPYFALKNSASAMSSMPDLLCTAGGLPIKFAIAGPPCEAIKLTEKAIKINTRVVAGYTLAATICLSACLAIAWTGIGELAAGRLCWIPSAVAGANDIVGLSELSKEAKGAISGLSVGATAVGATQAVAQAAVTGEIGVIREVTLSNASCVGAAVNAGVAAAKYISIPSERKVVNKNCETVKLSLAGGLASAVNPCPSPSPSSSTASTVAAAQLPGGTSRNQTTAHGAKSGSSGASDSKGGADNSDIPDFDAQVNQAATAGFEKLGTGRDVSKLAKDAKSLGIDVDDIEKKLAAGASPSQAIAGLNIPGMSAEQKSKMTDMFNKVETLVAQGKFFTGSLAGVGIGDKTVTGSTYTAGAAPHKIAAVRNFTFGSMAPAGPTGDAKPTEVGFEGQRNTGPDALIDTGDNIWHSEWTGTIFDIVSIRIDYSRPKVEQVEWATPENKFIAGSNIGASLVVSRGTAAAAHTPASVPVAAPAATAPTPAAAPSTQPQTH